MDMIAWFTPSAKFDSSGVHLVEQFVHVLHRLDPETYDADEVGAMYRVAYSNGVQFDAFRDELDFTRQAPSHAAFYEGT